MSDKDTAELFGSKPAGTTDSGEGGKPVAQATDKTQEALAILVGEGRKYKTVEDLAKSRIDADDFIETLKKEKQVLQEQLEKMKVEAIKGKTFDEVLERIEDSRRQAGDTTSVSQKAITAADIERLVDARITGRETAKTRDANVAKAQDLLTQKYGEKAKEVYLTKADTPEKRAAMNALAAVDPVSFAALFQTEAVVGNPADSSNKSGDTLNVQQQSGRANDPECKEYYDALRKKDPAKFYSQSTQLEMHKKAAANPSKFLGRKVA